MNFSFLQHRMAVAVMIVATGVLLSSCLKDKDNNVPDVPAAGLMAFNLASDQQSIDIRLSGSSLLSAPLAFSNYTGLYKRIYTGARDVQSFDFPDPVPLTTLNYDFKKDQYYSVFVVGRDSNYRNIVAIDSVANDVVTSGSAYIRYINAIADSSSELNVRVANTVNEPAAFGRVSDFVAVTPGEIAVAIKNTGSIDVSRPITVQAGRLYTILLLGVPGATDEQKKVQIPFVENGVLSADSGT